MTDVRSCAAAAADEASARAERLITPQAIEAYARDGAVKISGLLTPQEVDRLREGIDHQLAHPSPRAIVASRPDDPGHFVEDFCCWSEIPAYRALILDGPLAAVAARLMGSTTVRLYHDHMLTKEPGTRQKTPWHQDQPYYNIEGRQNLSLWIPVDPVPRHSTLECLAGSHRGPWLMPRTFLTEQARWFPEGSLAERPDIESRRAGLPIVGWPLEPGDAVAFHMLTLHAAGPVDGDRRRRVFSVRFLGDDIRHAPRPWKTSPDFPGLADTLAAGAPMDHPLFPLLWPPEAAAARTVQAGGP